MKDNRSTIVSRTVDRAQVAANSVLLTCIFAQPNPFTHSPSSSPPWLMSTFVVTCGMYFWDIPRRISAHCPIIRTASPVITYLLPDQRTTLISRAYPNWLCYKFQCWLTHVRTARLRLAKATAMFPPTFRKHSLSKNDSEKKESIYLNEAQ